MGDLLRKIDLCIELEEEINKLYSKFDSFIGKINSKKITENIRDLENKLDCLEFEIQEGIRALSEDDKEKLQSALEIKINIITYEVEHLFSESKIKVSFDDIERKMIMRNTLENRITEYQRFIKNITHKDKVYSLNNFVDYDAE